MLAVDGAARRSVGAIDAMLGNIRHRGPDDEGVWTSADGNAGFAHTRLSILDLTAAGHQPMHTADGRLTITYNGEIYNFHELRRALEQRGDTFTTRTDTEVILKAYQRDGADCIKSLRGMFALAIWDERDRSCLLARDRFGIKPLYYHAADGRLTFASEVKALVASGAVPVELDPQGAFGYFLTGTVPEPHTLLRDVQCLDAGTYVIWKDGQLKSRRYWQLEFADEPVDAPVEETRRALVDSIAHHFVSDAPVGIFLSGGIDSTALVALSRDAGQHDLHTFSLSFPGDPADEGVIAAQTALHFGTTHAEWSIDAATGRELFAGFLRAGDQPSIDGLNTFAVSRFARQHGMKVVLSGLGGDELFGGYPSFGQVPRLHAWNRRMARLGRIRPALGKQLESSAADPRWRRLGDLFTQPAELAHTYHMFRAVFTHQEARALVERYTGTTVCQTCDPLSSSPPSLDPTMRDAISRLELNRYMRNQPLRDSDTMSMAWGLELRVPFLDGPLVDTISRIPAAIRLQPGKRLLLQAVPEIPSWVATQPKRGFMFPFQRWLKDEWREMFIDIERGSPVRTETWYRKWCLFVFERWLERMKRSQHG